MISYLDIGRYTIFFIALGGPVVECLPGGRDVVGSILGWVIPKTLKNVLGASLLSTMH